MTDNHDVTVNCAACNGKQWIIYQNEIQCGRCGIAYIVAGIHKLPMSLIKKSIPEPEIIKALGIIDSLEK